MAFRFFAIPIRDPQPAQEELNSFLQSHKVLSIDRRWVDQGTDSFWSFCVDYHVTGAKPAVANRGKKNPQVDYREVLSEEDFAAYSERPKKDTNLTNANWRSWRVVSYCLVPLEWRGEGLCLDHLCVLHDCLISLDCAVKVCVFVAPFRSLDRLQYAMRKEMELYRGHQRQQASCPTLLRGNLQHG